MSRETLSQPPGPSDGGTPNFSTTGGPAAQSGASLQPPYRLEVYMEVTEDNWKRFQNFGIQFVPVFAKEHLFLKQSMFVGPSEGCPNYVVYNYWDLDGDLNNLARASIRLPDYPGFGVLDKVLEREVKNIVLPAPKLENPAPPSSQSFGYLRVESTLLTIQAAAFVECIAETRDAFNKKNGWELGEAFVPVTGTDEMLVQLWRVPLALSETAVAAALADAPWKDLIKGSKFTLMSLTEFDPENSATATTRASVTAPESLGGRSLVIRSGGENSYFYVRETVWRQRKLTLSAASTADAALSKTTATRPWTSLGSTPLPLLVNLDDISGLPVAPGGSNPPGTVETLPTRGIVIHEQGSFFAVPESAWTPTPLETDLSQANARVLVDRGAVVANLPPNEIPVGAYCVLINLDGAK